MKSLLLSIYSISLLLVLIPAGYGQESDPEIETNRRVLAQQADMATLQSGLENHQKDLDQFWLIFSSLLVLGMQIGFCLIKMGQVRSKNCLNVAMKSLVDFSAVTLCFLFLGFTLMYGIGSEDFKAFDPAKLKIWDHSGDDSLWSFVLFQIMLAMICCSIASGSMAGRTKFIGYLFYALILGSLIYPIFGHWVRGSQAAQFGLGGEKGWLEALGFQDFAGASMVHVVGGAAALAGIIIVGPRIGRFGKDGSPFLVPGHNLSLLIPGALVVWVGWFGLIIGAGVLAEAELGRICINTVISGAAGCITALVIFWLIRGAPVAIVALNGLLGGLVAVTAACDVINPLGALIIGCVAGLVANFGVAILEKMKLDDVTGSVPVHLFNGIWATLAVALLGKQGFNLDQLKIQALGSFSIAIGTFLIALTLFKLLDLTVGLRATRSGQKDGLDFSEHSSNVYPDFGAAK